MELKTLCWHKTYLFIFLSIFSLSASDILVIIPCHSLHAKHLKELLFSLEKQTLLPKKIVISISNSTDESDFMGEELSQLSWPFNLKIVSTAKSCRPGDNKNIAVSHLKNENDDSIVIVQDADDLSHRQRFEIVNYFFETYDCDHLMHTYSADELIGADLSFDEITYCFFDAWKPNGFKKKFKVKKLDITHGEIAFRKKIAQEHKWTSKFSGEDQQFNEKIYNDEKFKKVIINCPLVQYRHELSTSPEIWKQLGLRETVVGEVLFQDNLFKIIPGKKLPMNWSSFSPLESYQPTYGVVSTPNAGTPGALYISCGDHLSINGSWKTEVSFVFPENWYRFECQFHTTNVPWSHRQVLVRLNWLDKGGQCIGQPEYVPVIAEEGLKEGWVKAAATYQPPSGTTSVRIDLCLNHAPGGTVYWDEISFKQVSKRLPRLVKIGTTNYRSTGGPTNLSVAQQFRKVVEEAGNKGCDILLLGEAITQLARSHIPIVDKTETIPGELTEYFGVFAKKHSMYIILGIIENDNGTLYNTIVLLDRKGLVAGKYRKVFLPVETVEEGVTCGDKYPIFETDFGKIGLLSCYDMQFPEPTRAFTLQGAEIVFWQNWGNTFPAFARAIENQIYIVTAGYDKPTNIIDTQGRVVVEAKKKNSLIVSDIDLNQISESRVRQYLFHELHPEATASPCDHEFLSPYSE